VFKAKLITMLALSGIVLFLAVLGVNVGLRAYSSSLPRQTAASEITLVAYGDTRSGVWGLGDNIHQRIHCKVVQDIICPSSGPSRQLDAVIFTGDAVMTNFPGWKDSYWSSFFKQTNRLVMPNASVKVKCGSQTACVLQKSTEFYPTLGNHETYKFPLLLQSLKSTGAPAAIVPVSFPQSASDSDEELSKAYDDGEASYAIDRSAIGLDQSKLRAYSPVETDRLKADMEKMPKATPEQRKKTARDLGRFEGAVQYEFYAEGARARCNTDGQALSDAYLGRAGYSTYLKDIVVHDDKPRSYYSKLISKGDVNVTLVGLDTNCLDDPEQWNFFQKTVAEAPGRVIVFGHHPPVKTKVEDPDYDSRLPWDQIKGWDPDKYRGYLQSAAGKKIVLWIFGHVHNYQRHNASSSESVATPVAPVLLIAGGGGASALDKEVAGNQWTPQGWSHRTERAYNYLVISLRKDKVDVTVFGAKSRKDPFSKVDTFSVQ
jgi:hypothetical protein